MSIDDLTIRELREITKVSVQMSPGADAPPRPPVEFKNPVVAHFIGRFVFVCNLRIKGDFCYLTNVRNLRYWDDRKDGLGGLATTGAVATDVIDNWPDQTIPLDKLGPVMSANPEIWEA